MTKLNTVGVDLAKSVIQVSVVTPAGKELVNRSLTRKKFGEFLATQKPSLIAFEACASAHHWARTAKGHGHEVRLLPAISVSPFRQGHKTDENDALAVAEAAGRPNLKEAPLKSVEQQALQAIATVRQRLSGSQCPRVSSHGQDRYPDCEPGVQTPQRVGRGGCPGTGSHPESTAATEKHAAAIAATL